VVQCGAVWSLVVKPEGDRRRGRETARIVPHPFGDKQRLSCRQHTHTPHHALKERKGAQIRVLSVDTRRIRDALARIQSLALALPDAAFAEQHQFGANELTQDVFVKVEVEGSHGPCGSDPDTAALTRVEWVGVVRHL